MRVIVKLIVTISLLLAYCNSSYAMPDFERLADCIHRVENGTWPDRLGKGEQYGIHSIKIASNSPVEARKVCLATLKHKYTHWQVSNTKIEPYLQYLSKRYCPVNHANWYRMVSCYYNKGGHYVK